MGHSSGGTGFLVCAGETPQESGTGLLAREGTEGRPGSGRVGTAQCPGEGVASGSVLPLPLGCGSPGREAALWGGLFLP